MPTITFFHQYSSCAYAYDGANRLKTAGTNNSSEYDGDGRKVKGVSGGYALYYLWSSVLNEPVVELDGQGGVYRAYVYSSGGRLPALRSYDGQFYWAHTDHLGSGRMLTDTAGAWAVAPPIGERRRQTAKSSQRQRSLWLLVLLTTWLKIKKLLQR